MSAPERPRPPAPDDTVLLPAARGERRRRLEEERRLAALAAQEDALHAAHRAAPDPVRQPEPMRRPRERETEPTSSVPVIRPPVRPPTPEEARAAGAVEGDDVPQPRLPSWDDALTGRVPTARERVNRERPTTPRHSAAAGSGEVPPPRDRTLSALLVAVLVVGLAVAGGLFWVLSGRAPEPAPARASAPAGQATLLVVLDDGRGTLLAGSLLGVTEDSAVSVLVPGGLQVDGLAPGRGLLAQTLDGAGAGPGEVLAELLRVRVDGTLRLSPQAVVEAVDAVGGVVVDVDREVVAGSVLVPQGRGQRLDGAQAAAFAAARADGEPEEARLARVGAVLSQLLESLPSGQDQVDEFVREVAPASTDLGDDGLAAFLGRAHGVAVRDGVAATVLPVTAGTAGDESAYRLDAAAADALLTRLLPWARTAEPDGGPVRVLVRNGQGTPGLSEAARQRLQEVGLRFVGGGNADSFDHDTSQVLVGSGDPAAAEEARRVAAALGLPPGTVAVSELATSVADVVVVLGKDFADDVAARGVVPSATP